VKLLAIAAAALLTPTVAAAPPRAPELVTVRVAHERATGFVAGDERVVTVAHVLGGDEVTVDGRPATIVRVERRNDLAVLRVPGVRGAPARFGGRAGTSVLGRAARVVRRISASVDGGPRRAALVLRAEVQIGDSGAPVVTPGGRVAGVVFARSRARDDVAYAVDASAVAAVLR
jgi:hypothetical protein